MSDKLDNDLKNRIREVFDNYTDDTADAGWDLLRQKFPEEKKRRVIAWWWYSAAAALLLCFGTWFFYPKSPATFVASQQKHQQIDTATAISGKNPVTGDKNAEAKIAQSTTKALDNTSPAQQLKQKLSTVTSSDVLDKKPLLVATNKATKHSVVDGNNSTKQNNTASAEISTSSSNLKAGESLATLGSGDGVKSKSAKNYQPKQNSEGKETVAMAILPAGIKANSSANNYAGQNVAKASPSINATGDMLTDSTAGSKLAMATTAQQSVKPTQTAIVVQKQDPVLKMIAADDARRLAAAKNAVKKNETVKSDRAMILSLYAATYFNYAKGSQNQLGVGGGVSSDFRISDNFKISTGLSIAQNRLSYSSDNSIPQQINNNALALVNRNTASSFAAYTAVSAGLRDDAVSPSVKNYSANLVGLDIPLNIKYQFNPHKSDTYISAGISSGTYINESYRSTYSYGNSVNSAADLSGKGLNAIVTNAQQTQESTTNQHFGSFDFAKTLNLSFGVGYPMGKTTRLVIEPFLKYPLNGLGTQDIRFGASGINLKLSFSSKK